MTLLPMAVMAWMLIISIAGSFPHGCAGRSGYTPHAPGQAKTIDVMDIDYNVVSRDCGPHIAKQTTTYELTYVDNATRTYPMVITSSLYHNFLNNSQIAHAMGVAILLRHMGLLGSVPVITGAHIIVSNLLTENSSLSS